MGFFSIPPKIDALYLASSCVLTKVTPPLTSILPMKSFYNLWQPRACPRLESHFAWKNGEILGNLCLINQCPAFMLFNRIPDWMHSQHCYSSKDKLIFVGAGYPKNNNKRGRLLLLLPSLTHSIYLFITYLSPLWNEKYKSKYTARYCQVNYAGITV